MTDTNTLENVRYFAVFGLFEMTHIVKLIVKKREEVTLNDKSLNGKDKFLHLKR